MANYKNTDYFAVTGKQSIPENVSKTGTIETIGKAVIGTSTLFKTEIQAGSWIVDESQDELRKVVHVESDTLAYLDNAFTSDIAALTTPSVIPRTSLNIKSISVSISPLLADEEVEGVAFNAGAAMSWAKNGMDNRGIYGFIDPIIVDGTGTVINVAILK
jgi:hypothetical protein